jgi:prophage regulatory protein
MSNKHHSDADMADKVLRLPEVKRTTGKSRSSIYQEMRAGSFPRQIHIGPRAVGWLESDINAWLAKVTAASAVQAGNERDPPFPR